MAKELEEVLPSSLQWSGGTVESDWIQWLSKQLDITCSGAPEKKELLGGAHPKQGTTKD